MKMWIELQNFMECFCISPEMTTDWNLTSAGHRWDCFGGKCDLAVSRAIALIGLLIRISRLNTSWLLST